MTQLVDPTAAFITTNGHKNRYVSTCSVCGLGVFEPQKWVFSTGRVLGICHQSCVDGAK